MRPTSGNLVARNDVQAKLRGNVQQLIQKQSQPPSNKCWEAAGGYTWDSVTVQATLSGGNLYGVADIFVRLPRPCKTLILASVGATEPVQEDGIYFHLGPLGKTYPTGGLPPAGTEQWIEIKSADASTVVFTQGWQIEFPEPITSFYLDVVNGPGNAHNFFCTFLLADGVKITYRPAPNNIG